MRKLVRLLLVIVGVVLMSAWWMVLDHIMKSPIVWVGLLQWLGECVLFIVASLFIFAGLLFGANASVHKPKGPARVVSVPPPDIPCEQCSGMMSDLYSLKRDMMLCRPCAIKVTHPLDDLYSVSDGHRMRLERTLAQRG